MRIRPRLLTPVVALLLGALALAACAGGAAHLAPVDGPIDQSRAGGGPAPTGAPAPPGENGGSAAVRDGARIIRTGELHLQVSDPAEATARARLAIAGLGGYVGSSQVSREGDQTYATVTYRIPSDRWDEGLEALRGLAEEVLLEQTDAVEVTSQIVDLDARITNLRASERALQRIAESATRISDVLEVEGRLTEVRGEIERLVAQKTNLEDQVGYGTLTVTFGIDVIAVTQAVERWDPGDEVDRATASLVDVLQGLATAGIWFGIVWLPILVVVGTIGIIAVFVLRRLGVTRRRTVSSEAPGA